MDLTIQVEQVFECFTTMDKLGNLPSPPQHRRRSGPFSRCHPHPKRGHPTPPNRTARYHLVRQGLDAGLLAPTPSHPHAESTPSTTHPSTSPAPSPGPA